MHCTYWANVCVETRNSSPLFHNSTFFIPSTFICIYRYAVPHSTMYSSYAPLWKKRRRSHSLYDDSARRSGDRLALGTHQWPHISPKMWQKGGGSKLLNTIAASLAMTGTIWHERVHKYISCSQLCDYLFSIFSRLRFRYPNTHESSLSLYLSILAISSESG